MPEDVVQETKKRFKTRYIVLLLITAGVALALAMSNVYVSGEYRYRITIEVQTPEGIKTGAAVRAVTDHASSIKVIDLPGVGGSRPKVRGEAVVVDLGEKGKLFGLIDWDSYREVYAAFPFAGAEKAGDGLRYYLNLKPGAFAPLPEKQWPKFVTFTDMDDPKSVKSVPHDNLESVFGKGYAIKNIIIKITDEPITWGDIQRYLNQRHAVGPYEFIRGEAK